MKAAAQIREAEACDAAAQRRHQRTQQHAENADIGTQRIAAQPGQGACGAVQRGACRRDGREARVHGRRASGAEAAPVSIVATTDMPGRTSAPITGL
jgi:hypothetical protein